MVGRAVGQGIIAVFFHVPAIHFRFDLAVGDSGAADCCLHVGMTGAVQGKMTENAVQVCQCCFFVTAASPPAGSRKEECDAWPLVDGNAGLVYLVFGKWVVVK